MYGTGEKNENELQTPPTRKRFHKLQCNKPMPHNTVTKNGKYDHHVGTNT
jgi:hypothetical protein